MARTCAMCGRGLEGKRPSAKFCSDRCRVRSYRHPEAIGRAQPSRAAEEGDGPLRAAARAELAAGGRLNSSTGQAALALASRIDSGERETGSSMAALVKEYRTTLAAALKSAGETTDPLDELRARRERKRNAG